MKTIVITCTFSVMLLAGSAASASPLTWAQVGNVDNLVASGTADNSGQGEKLWIANALGIPVGELVYEQVDNSGGAFWQPVLGTDNIFAFDLGAEPSWFMLKTGAGAENAAGEELRNFLYENLDELQYATIDFTELGFDKIEIGKVSHVSIPGGTDLTTENLTPVPEPASLTLLGAGLAAVGAKLRRRKQQVQ